MDKIDKIQSNNLLPFEQAAKDKLAERSNVKPKDVDDVGISKEYWMVDFRDMWNNEYPLSAEKISEDNWASWYKNFSSFTRQDVEYGFNEVRKKPRDYPPSVSVLYDFLIHNAQKRIKIDDVGKAEGRCQDKEAGTCTFGDPFWQLNKYGKHDFKLMCIWICDNAILAEPDAYWSKRKPKPQTKGEWFVTVASLMSNDDETRIGGSAMTPRDRKFDTYAYAEMFPDGNIKEVLASFNLDENLSFKEQCIAISGLPKKKGLLGGNIL